jgi:hypothetical protein
MKRITNEETSQYTPYQRTLLSPNPTYFSVFEEEGGWDEIRYYIDAPNKTKDILTEDDVDSILKGLGD